MPYKRRYKKKVYRKRNNKKMVRYKRPSSLTTFMRVELRKTGTVNCDSISTPNNQTYQLNDFQAKSKFTALWEQYRVILIKQIIYPTVQLSGAPMSIVGSIDSQVVDLDTVPQVLESLIGVKIDRDDISGMTDLNDCLKNPKVKIHNGSRIVNIKFKPNILIATTNTGNQSVVYDRWLDTANSSDEPYYGLNKLFHVNGATADFPVTFRVVTSAIVEFKRFRTDES